MVTYRELKSSDFPVVADFIWRMWASDEVKAKPEVALDYGYFILYSELLQSSVAFVADDGGRACGILVLNVLDGHPHNSHYLAKMTEHLLRMSEDPDGAVNVAHSLEVMRTFKDSEEVLAGKGIGAEVALFINDADHRGQGVGSGMFKHMAEYLHQRGVKKFFLHTDEYSYHNFYGVHRGMKILDARRSSGSIGDIKGVKLYIYADDVENQLHD